MDISERSFCKKWYKWNIFNLKWMKASYFCNAQPILVYTIDYVVETQVWVFYFMSMMNKKNAHILLMQWACTIK